MVAATGFPVEGVAAADFLMIEMVGFPITPEVGEVVGTLGLRGGERI